MAVASTTIAIAAIATALVSAGVGAYSSVAAAGAQEDAAKYNAAVARNNAIMADQQAKYEADRIRKRNILALGEQTSAYAKAGVDIAGSPQDVLLDSMSEGELDVAAARYSGKVSSTNLVARAKLSEAQGADAARAGYLNAGATILGGAGQAASIYSNYSRANKEPTF